MEWNISTIANILISAGVLAIGIGYTYGQFFKGKKTVAIEATETGISTLGYLTAQVNGLQKLVAQLQTEAKERQIKHQDELKNLHEQMGNLRGQLMEKDKLIDYYTKIFQGRDPELVEILNKVANSLDQIQGFMQEMKDKVSVRKDSTNLNRTRP